MVLNLTVRETGVSSASQYRFVCNVAKRRKKKVGADPPIDVK